jgi:hypothetical protein
LAAMAAFLLRKPLVVRVQGYAQLCAARQTL